MVRVAVATIPLVEGISGSEDGSIARNAHPFEQQCGSHRSISRTLLVEEVEPYTRSVQQTRPQRG